VGLRCIYVVGEKLDHRHLERVRFVLALAEMVEDVCRRSQYVGLGAIEAGNGEGQLESVGVYHLATAVVLQVEEVGRALRSGVSFVATDFLLSNHHLDHNCQRRALALPSIALERSHPSQDANVVTSPHVPPFPILSLNHCDVAKLYRMHFSSWKL